MKADNVLVTADLATAKVADFGVALSMETIRTTAATGAGSGSMTGTLAFKAPETFKDQYSEASDMFSMGVMVWEVGSRQQPFNGVGFAAINMPAAGLWRRGMRSGVPLL